MELWQQMLRQSVDSGRDLVDRFGFDRDLADRLNSLFHTRINPYYLSLIRYPGDPIWLQCVPDARELIEDGFPEDPLAEDSHSPVPSIVHRYPDRVLFLTTTRAGSASPSDPPSCRLPSTPSSSHTSNAYGAR